MGNQDDPLFEDFDDGWRRFQPGIPKAGSIAPEGNILQLDRQNIIDEIARNDAALRRSVRKNHW